MQANCQVRIDCGRVLRNREKNYNYHFDVVNYCMGNHLFESDIVMTEKQKDWIETHHSTEHKRREKRAAASVVDLWQDYKRGKNFVVPYEIGANISVSTLDVLEAAIAEYNKYTCIRLKPRVDERHYIEFVGLEGCWSFVGKHGDKQELSLGDGCDSIGTVVHEILHALGFWHEQSRPDRDDHLLIVYDNVKPENTHNFDMYTTQRINSLNSPYDPQSIMQYGGYAFTKNGQPTIIDRVTQRPTEWAEEWSHHDIMQLNIMYGCSIKEKVCNASSLPTLEGKGKIIPEKDSYHPQEKVRLHCDKGYSPHSAEVSICKNQAFDETEFVCKKDLCEDTKDDCGHLKSLGYCDTKPTLMEIKCAATCDMCGKCVTLPTVEGEGWIDPYYNVYAKNESVILTCVDGWMPTSDIESVCLGDVWTVSHFVCVPGEEQNCTSPPMVIGRGSIFPELDTYLNGDVVELSCSNNTVPMEDVLSTCNNGFFYPEVLICDEIVQEKKCDQLILPLIEGHGYFEPMKDVYEEEDEVTLKCAEGLVPLVNQFALCIAGFFIPHRFACVSPNSGSTCSFLPHIEGLGSFEPSKETYEPEEQVQLVCADGYVPFEDSVTVCLNGNFYPDFMICEKQAPEPGCDNNTLPFINGRGKYLPEKEFYSEGDVVTLMCEAGYQAEAPGAVAFCHQGYFDPYVAYCKRVGCHKDTLPFIEGDGFIQPLKEEYKEGDIISLVCGEGLSAGLEHEAMCHDGYFEPEAMYCLPSKCTRNTLPYLEGNGSIQPLKDVYEEEETIYLICGDGYEPLYELTAQCLVGEFFPMVLTCVKIFTEGCTSHTLPAVIGPGSLTNPKDFYELGEKVQLICDSGFGAKRFTNEAECIDNAFYPFTLKCKKNKQCWDKETRCEKFAKEGRCSEQKIKRRCRVSCGVCTK